MENDEYFHEAVQTWFKYYRERLYLSLAKNLNHKYFESLFHCVRF